MNTRNKQRIKGVWIIYLILSLLFVVSVKLHIHSGDEASHVAHGEAVAITIFDGGSHDSLHQHASEIPVGLDKFSSVIKKNLSLTLFVVMAMSVLLIVRRYCVAILYEITPPYVALPFAGTPPLRGPPL